MVESEVTISSYFSKSNGDSLLSGSACYLTDIGEDSKAISDALEEVDRVTAEVLQYLFETLKSDILTGM